jgi:hypothetical protein
MLVVVADQVILGPQVVQAAVAQDQMAALQLLQLQEQLVLVVAVAVGILQPQ